MPSGAVDDAYVHEQLVEPRDRQQAKQAGCAHVAAHTLGFGGGVGAAVPGAGGMVHTLPCTFNTYYWYSISLMLQILEPAWRRSNT
jgi:hypothetical protein